jgi:disulfide oxidoreductase YuzD
VVGLVKAKFPEQLERIRYANIFKDHFNELERYTRIKNKCLENSVMYNLAKQYDPQHPSLIYLDELVLYLPSNT